MSMSAREAALLRIKEALGAHIIADSYRDAFPDSEEDALHLRKQETYWRLKARQWLTAGDMEACHARAKRRAAEDPAHKAQVETLVRKLK